MLFLIIWKIFSGNGYDIVVKKTFEPKEITLIFGVCDEDMYHKAIKIMNQETKTGQAVFNHIMTASNHRITR
jgi:phosphoglycerol transferase MdoB-like AlkP superfamily enzyme